MEAAEIRWNIRDMGTIPQVEELTHESDRA